MHRLVRLMGSMAALTLSSTASAGASLNPHPWLSSGFAPAEATRILIYCNRGDWSPCFSSSQLELALPNGGPFSVDNEFLSFSGQLVSEVSGNAWDLGLRSPSLVVKRDFGLGSDEIRSLSVFLYIGGMASLATPPGNGGVVPLAFGSDLRVTPEIVDDSIQSSFEIIDGGVRSERIDREHTAVVDFMAGDIVSTRGAFVALLGAGYDGSTATIDVRGASPCTEDVSELAIEACEIRLEVWAPSMGRPNHKDEGHHR